MSKKGKIIIAGAVSAMFVAGFLIFVFSRIASKTDFGETRNYTHPGYGFSFEYPDGWNVSSFAEGEGETVLIQPGVQIYISIFDEEETALTKERILADIPDLKIENDKQIKIANTIDALSFDSANQGGQNTKEVWFVYNRFLYQISAAGNGGVLDKIINTFKFN